MIKKGFLEEVTFKLRAEEVRSANVSGKSIPRRGNCKRKFLILTKE